LVAGGAVVAVGRQLLFPWRDLPRDTSHGRLLTIAVTALVVFADVMAASSDLNARCTDGT